MKRLGPWTLLLLSLSPRPSFAEEAGEGESSQAEEKAPEALGEGEAEATKPQEQPQAESAPIPVLDKAKLTPEEQVSYIRNQLITLKDHVQSFKSLYEHDGLASQTVGAQEALAAARHDYEEQEYRSAVRNLNQYLNSAQVPGIKDYLEAQYLLGKSYDALQEKLRASKAFSRYLATLTTNPGHLSSKSIEVVSLLLEIVEAGRFQYQIELGPLMAALTSLEVPAPQKAFIYFFAGKSARMVSNDKVALYWLNLAIRNTTNARLIARSRYNRGLIYIRQQNYQEAIADLKFALEETSEGAQDYTQWAKIALARIYVHLKKPNTALTFYDDISDDAPAYKESLIEKVYLYLGMNKAKEAILAAEEFLIRYPKSEQAYVIRSTKAYLDLSASNLKDAKDTIELGAERLTAISQWLIKNYRERDTLTLRDISGIMRVTQPELPHPPAIRAGRTLFQRLESLKQRASDLRNDLRQSVFTLGRNNPDKLNPSWQNRITQMRSLALSLLESGDLLAQAEAGLYAKRLSDRDAYVLKASHFRRQRGLSKTAEFARHKAHFHEWGDLGEMSQRVAKRFRRVKELQSHLASGFLLAKTVKVRMPTARLSEIAELQHKTQVMEGELLRAMEIIKSRQATTAIAMAEISPLRALVKEQAEALIDETTILTRYRNEYQTPQQQHLSTDLDKTWGLWSHVLETLYTQVLLLQKEMTETIQDRLIDIDTQIKAYDDLISKIDSIETNLSRTMGHNLGPILGHYQGQIEERTSKHQKWLADIKWIAFEKTSQEKNEAMEKYRFEQQILKENLKNLEQGVLWQWP